MIAQADVGMLDGLERALINGRLRMVYQPKISLSDGRLRRVEALVRWDDPELGTIPPSRFVPLAEQHGLIDQMTQWGLRTTLRQWLSWVEQGLDTCLASQSVAEAGVAVVPLSPFAEQDPPRHMIRLCFAKRDETIDAGVEAMAKARNLMR